MDFKKLIGNKETWVKVGKKAGQYSKLIVVEGVKSVALQGTTKVVNTVFTKGPQAVKELKFEEDIIGLKKPSDKPKRKLFGKKKEAAEELLEEIPVEKSETVEVIEPEHVEIIDKK